MSAELLHDGPLGQWHPAVIGFLTLLTGGLAYMVIGTVALFILLLGSGTSFQEFMSGEEALLARYSAEFFGGNAVGLALGMGLFAVLVARAVSSQPWTLLRVRTIDGVGTLLAVAGLVAITPFIVWLGEWNAELPLPEFLRAQEQQQLELLEIALSSEGSIFLKLVLVALTPALFEEVFFRGMLQRSFERAWGAAAGIVVTGVLFGLFHFRFSQALPLIVIGLYLAYLAWRCNSIWVPVVVHLVNNAAALLIASTAENGADLSRMEEMNIPWAVTGVGLLMFAGVIWLFQRRNRR